LILCPNCGTTLQGRFCHACGQKTGSAHISLHDFAHEAWHEFAHVDGKIAQTLRLLVFKPGALTQEFLNYYSIHFHAFTFAALTAFALCALAGRHGRISGSIAMLAIVPYHYTALRRVFGGSRIRTLALGTAVGNFYWMAVAAVMILIAFRTLKGM
jgi:Protein of unknown function (DUF3667)